MMFSYGPPHMAEQKQGDQYEPTYSSSVRIWDVAPRTCQKRRTIGRSGERGSGISMLVAQDDDGDDDDAAFNSGMATSLEGKLWIQTSCTPFKNWPCVKSCFRWREQKFDRKVKLISYRQTQEYIKKKKNRQFLLLILIFSLNTSIKNLLLSKTSHDKRSVKSNG